MADADPELLSDAELTFLNALNELGVRTCSSA